MYCYFLQAKANIQELLWLNKQQKPFNSKLIILIYGAFTFYFYFYKLCIKVQ